MSLRELIAGFASSLSIGKMVIREDSSSGISVTDSEASGKCCFTLKFLG